MLVVMIQRAGEEKSARMLPRNAATRALRSKKNNTVKKNHPRVGRGIKNAAKAMKEPVLITVFSLVNSFQKKGLREKEREFYRHAIRSLVYTRHDRQIDRGYKTASLQISFVECLSIVTVLVNI